MKTFQEYEKAKANNGELEFIKQAITEYRSSEEYRTALDADEYEAERNITIMEFTRWLYNSTGSKVEDMTVSNNKIASNFFHRLTTQRASYSLGNGISFASKEKKLVDGKWVNVDATKDRLGSDFDTVIYTAAHYALIHGCSYLFWNLDHADIFKLTEFCPIYDEYNGRLKAGFRFWSLDWDKRPVTVVVYEQDGYTKWRTKEGSTGLDLDIYEPKRAYKQQIAHNNVDPDEIISDSNYSDLPIIPLWGSKHHQSDLVGMRSKIDAIDLVTSGFANDLEDCAEIFWIVSNALGMTNEDLSKFRDTLKLQHIAVMDTDNSGITPYKQDIPTEARLTLINSLRAQIYDDYGALDVTHIGAGANITATEIRAAYQTMDEEADDFEYEVIKAIRGILNLIGIDDMPIFYRNRVSNEYENTQMILMAANYLDEETVLSKLPFITPDEVETIIARRQAMESFAANGQEEEPEEEEQAEKEV